MPTDTNPRRNEAESQLALLGLAVAIMIFAVVLCLSYLYA
jgi:hypothetical protein